MLKLNLYIYFSHIFLYIHPQVLLSNDINLLNKALVSGVSAVSKDQFEKQICGDAESKSVNHTALSKNPELSKQYYHALLI